MEALQLAEQVRMVGRSTTGAEAARVVAEYRMSGLVVAGNDGVPIAVIPGSQLLSLVLPQYVRDDPKLAHAYDERWADELCGVLNEATIGELLEAKRLSGVKPPSVLPQDTLIEVASAMDSGHMPLILVVGRDGIYHGVITLIVTEKFNDTAVALLGAAGMVAIGSGRGHEIFFSEDTGIDWNVIFLLFGMMVIVGVLRQTGVFGFFAIWSAQRARGRPFRMMVPS